MTSRKFLVPTCSVLVLSSFFVGAGVANAQCTPQWLVATTGIDNAVISCDTLPNGDLVAGGAFSTIGGISAGRIARRTGSTWTALGTGVNGAVEVVAAHPNGDVLAGGFFQAAGGVTVNGIARWNGSNWSSLGTGLGFAGVCQAIAVLANGDIIAGGTFSFSTPTGTATNIARFDGTTWSPVSLGLNGPVHDLGVLRNGRVIAVGNFNTAFGAGGSISTLNIAAWTPPPTNAWSRVGPGTNPGGDGTNGPLYSVAIQPNDDIVVGGQFTLASGPTGPTAVAALNVARCSNNTWYPLGPGLGGGVNPLVRALTVHINGDILAGGTFTTSGATTLNRIGRWDGVVWNPLGTGMDSTVHGLTTIAEDVIAGGSFQTAGGGNSPYLATYDACPASALSYGSGCSSSAGPVLLQATTQPWLGQVFTATAIGMPAVSLAVAVWGNTQVSVPLSPGLPSPSNCTLLASADILIALVPSAGFVVSNWAIPTTTPAGIPVFHQIIALELDSTGAIIQATSSNGLTVIVGSL